MNVKSRIIRLLAAMLPLMAVAGATPALAADASDSEAIMLVATPEFQDPLYGETILIAKPIGEGRHLGFILNKPTTVSVAEAFPDHEPSQQVHAPIFLGGPSDVNAVFALVTSHVSPGPGSMRLADDLYLVVAAATVDHVIESDAEHARFFMGAVVWRPGELKEELRRGAWYTFDPEPELVLQKKTEGLWQQLVHRAEFREKGI